MPDWIHSRIYIRGNEAARNEITQANFDFKELAPCPEGTDEAVWHDTVYGTNFEGEPEIIDEDHNGQLCVITSSAWNPPTKFCKWLMNHYEDLWIKIIYEGDGSYGGLIILSKTKEDKDVRVKKFKWDEPYYDGEKLCATDYE